MTNPFMFDEDAPKTQAVNRSVDPTDCDVCGGDRFVVYQTRPAQTSVWMREHGIEASGQIEEYVLCPKCHADVDASYWAGGRKVTPPDPTQVKERLGL